jgi:protein O-mannosyl-transferase
MARSRLAIGIALAAAVLLALSPTLTNGLTGYDDPDYVTSNAHVNTGVTWTNIRWAFTAPHASNWHPLTWISHQLDCTLYGLAPAGHHVTSLFLHVTNMFLLFFWLDWCTGHRARSAWVSLAFGVHPLHVESVAWVAERKDVLSTLFAFSTLIAYTCYARRPRAGSYLITAACLAAGLLSKPMLVTLPFLLLVLDRWPLARKVNWRRAILEKAPLMALAGLSAAATVWAQRAGGSLAALDRLPLRLRLTNSIVSYLRYLAKALWPVNLAAFYPFPREIPVWEVTGGAAALAMVTWFVFRERVRRPWLAAGWSWYLLTLVPVIGIVQVGQQSMADRYMYVPIVGLLIAAAWQAADFCRGSRVRTGSAAAAGGIVLGIWAVLSWRQAHVWKDGLTLFTHAIAVTGDNFVAHDNRGVELDRLGRFDEALAEYRETLRIKPGDRNGKENLAQASFALGERLLAQGNLDRALAAFREGLRYRPRNALAHSEAGQILTRENRPAAAIAEFREALGIAPSMARAYLGLGAALAQSGRVSEAAEAFQSAVRYDPSMVEAHYDLGLVRAAGGRKQEALAAFDQALRVQPDYGPALAGRAQILYDLGRLEEARRAVAAALAAHADVDPALAARLAAGARR